MEQENIVIVDDPINHVVEKKQPVQKPGTRAQRRAEEKKTKKLMKKYHKQQAMIERIGREQFRGNDVVSAE